jgi:hypothetical protein
MDNNYYFGIKRPLIEKPTNTIFGGNTIFGTSTSSTPFTGFGSSSSTKPTGSTLFGSSNNTKPTGSTTLFGSSSNSTPFTGFGSSSSTPFTSSVKPASTTLFGSSSTNSTPFTGFGSSSSTKPASTTLFGSSTKPASTTLFGSSTKPTSTTGFGNINTSNNNIFVNTSSNSFSPISLKPLSLPRNKIEGLLFMVSLDQKHSLENSKNMLDNILKENVKLEVTSLWFLSLVSFSDPSFIMKKVNCDQSFVKMYCSLLQSLMFESIQTPEHLFEWLKINSTTKKMLWLLKLLKFSKGESFDDILDGGNEIEMFFSALNVFIKYDNNPTKAVEEALKSTNVLHKTFLLSMIGASYGKDFYYKEYNPYLTEMASRFI